MGFRAKKIADFNFLLAATFTTAPWRSKAASPKATFLKAVLLNNVEFQVQRSSSQDGQKKLQISVTKTAFWVDFSDQGCAFLSHTQIFFEINQESEPDIRLWVGWRRQKNQQGWQRRATTNRNVENTRTKRRGEERERMEGLRGARIFILFTFIPHTHLIRFVNILWTNFVASSIFCMPFDAKGGGGGLNSV